MSLVTKTCLLAIAFVAFTYIGANEASGAEWRWKRPLNEKPGSAFYTSNRAFKRSTNYRSRSWTNSRTYRTTYSTSTRSRPVYRIWSRSSR